MMDALEIEQATLLGHSYGGFLAQEVAIAHPDRFSGLVLLNTVPAFDYQPVPPGNDEQLAAFGSLFTEPCADDETLRSLWSTVWPMYFHRYDAELAAKIDEGTSYAAEAWNTGSGLLATFNTLDELGGVSVPTLNATGRHDFITPPEHGAERMHAVMPNSELAIFEDSGHYPFLEEESAFFARLRAFLRDRA